MYENVFVWLVVCPMHLILNCNAIVAQLSRIKMNYAKRRLHFVRKSVYLLVVGLMHLNLNCDAVGCMCDSLVFKLGYMS
jgi:hypothetical protein